MRHLRTTLLSLSALGVVVFAGAFVVSLVRPILVESVAREFVRRELEARVQARIAALDGSRLAQLAQLAQRMIDRNSQGTGDAKRTLAEDVPARVAALVARMQDPGCECRTFMQHATRSIVTLDALARTLANGSLDRLIRAKYAELAQALLREFRIFTSANALVFLLLGATLYFKRAAGLQLLLPTVVLAGAAIIVGALYLFGQDWLHTILFSRYIGLGYFGYLGIAILLLADIVFHHARITTQIVNAAFNLVGAAIQAVPC